ncbi:MAG: hypothetical protein U0359_37445 [Byssovorax sp.]
MKERPRRANDGALALSIALSLALSIAPGRASAQTAGDSGTRRVEAAARFEAAEKAYAELRYAEALTGYEDAAALDPSARFTLTARTRADDLKAHAEGGFAPLTRLDEVRRDPKKSADRAAIEALSRDMAAFPPGRVRGEAALLVAESFWHRLGEPARAIAPLSAVLDDPAADALTRSLAFTELLAVERELGDLDAAVALSKRFPDLAPGARAEVLRLARRETLRMLSIAVLAALALIGSISAARALRRRGGRAALALGPFGVAFALYLGGAAAALVRARGDGDPRPFVWLGLGVLGVLAAARAWAIGAPDRRAWARIVRALFCAAGVVAAAFLAVERTHASYLESLGL